VPRLRQGDIAGIIGELSQALQREGCVPDVLPFYQAALNQELLTSSALECGLAFPQHRLGGIRHFSLRSAGCLSRSRGCRKRLARAVGFSAGCPRD